jgi:hypothetical protein
LSAASPFCDFLDIQCPPALCGQCAAQSDKLRRRFFTYRYIIYCKDFSQPANIFRYLPEGFFWRTRGGGLCRETAARRRNSMA